MLKQISGIIPFPFDAQSNPFFCALASTLLPALDYTDEKPFFCGPKDSFCINCGDCGTKTTLQKHHLRLYHNYQTLTGVGLGWCWPEYNSKYQVIPGWHQGWSWPDDFFDFIFGFAGLSWKRLSKDMGKDDIFTAVQSSIDAGLPVLMRLKTDWRVITGYSGNCEMIGLGYGFDEASPLDDWAGNFDGAIIITGHCIPNVTYHDILARMIQALEHPAHKKLEVDLMTRMSAITPVNVKETAEWLLGLVGFPIEARWHAADSELYILCENKKAKEKIFGMIRQYVFDNEHDATHGTCWKIWSQLGVGPNTGYVLPPNAGELLLQADTQVELKRLFSIIFENDRVVLGLLREAAAVVK